MSEIKDGIFAYIGGTITDVQHSQSGLRAVVEVQSPKREYPDRVTVWGLPVAAAAGERIKVKGWLSWASREVDGKKYFNVSLNQPEVIAHENLVQAVTAEKVARDIVTAELSDEAPF